MGCLLGCIADDFTGATDLANTLAKNGMRVVQTVGVPKETFPAMQDVDAVVVALKSRSAPVELAVRDAVLAQDWLKALGCIQFF